MKKIISISGIAAVMITLGVISYQVLAGEKGSDETTMLQPTWWVFNMPAEGNYAEEALKAENYSPYTGAGDPECLIGNRVCAVKLIEGDVEGQPDQDALDALAADIANNTHDEDLLRFEQI
ncbi:hypothetical protein SAMN05421747_103201 [Parapedobacter composti]|uniref:Uncharacterized protein n=1 Tax=Parapedobacter composti TaxID=623281 RepID=A0A1I1FW36_9SPHI|nr:hypothetical protein [Parapedobacter composti]SFC03667.1 hypothetical protein SAMN05421747_103201 [Parapedobacter composti]